MIFMALAFVDQAGEEKGAIITHLCEAREGSSKKKSILAININEVLGGRGEEGIHFQSCKNYEKKKREEEGN